jgi:hypothetical protein
VALDPALIDFNRRRLLGAPAPADDHPLAYRLQVLVAQLGDGQRFAARLALEQRIGLLKHHAAHGLDREFARLFCGDHT